jgi:hypothetical protein
VPDTEKHSSLFCQDINNPNEQNHDTGLGFGLGLGLGFRYKGVGELSILLDPALVG